MYFNLTLIIFNMVTKISKTEEFFNKMMQEENVKTLDEPHHMQAIFDMNEKLEAVRRDFQVRNRNSQMNASKVILTN